MSFLAFPCCDGVKTPCLLFLFSAVKLPSDDTRTPSALWGAADFLPGVLLSDAPHRKPHPLLSQDWRTYQLEGSSIISLPLPFVITGRQSLLLYFFIVGLSSETHLFMFLAHFYRCLLFSLSPVWLLLIIDFTILFPPPRPHEHFLSHMIWWLLHVFDKQEFLMQHSVMKVTTLFI